MEELYFQEYMDKKCLPTYVCSTIGNFCSRKYKLLCYFHNDTMSCSMAVSEQVISVSGRPLSDPPPSSLLSGSNQERRGEGSCCRVTGAGGLTGLMRKFWWLESGNVRGEVWRRRQPFAVVLTLFSCMVSRLWGTSLYTRPTEKLCPAACSGCTVSYF